MKYTVDVMISRFHNDDVKGALTAASKLSKKDISTEQKQTVVEAVEALKNGAEMTDEVVLTGINTIKEMMGIQVEKTVVDSYEEDDEVEEEVDGVEDSVSVEEVELEEEPEVVESEAEPEVVESEEVESETEPEVEEDEVNDEKVVEEVASVEEVVTEDKKSDVDKSGVDKDLKWVLITIGRKGNEKGQLFVTVFDGDSRAKLTELQNEGKAFVALSTVSKLENLYNNNFDVRGGKGIKTNLTKRGIEDTLRFVDNLLYIAGRDFFDETVPVDTLGLICDIGQSNAEGVE